MSARSHTSLLRRWAQHRINAVSRAALSLSLLIGILTAIAVSVPAEEPSQEVGRAAPAELGYPQPSVETVTPQVALQALDAVRRFVPDHASAIEVDGAVSGYYGEAVRIAGPDVDALVDAASGTVVYARLAQLAPSDSSVTIDKDDALMSATEFLAAREVSVDGKAVTVELVDHGDVAEYVVRWATRITNVLRPDTTVVRVDPSNGAVFAVLTVARPHEEPLAPNLTQEEAVEIARARSSTTPHFVDADVRVWFDASGVQHTVWFVQLATSNDPSEYVQAVVVIVDATTATSSSPREAHLVWIRRSAAYSALPGALAVASVALLSGCSTTRGVTAHNRSDVSYVLVEESSDRRRAWEVGAGASGRTDMYGGRLMLMTHDCRIASGLSGYVGSEIVVDIDQDGSIEQRQEPRAEPGLPSLPATTACTNDGPATPP